MNGYIQNCITFPCSGKRPIVHKWNTLTTRLPHDGDSNYGILCGQKNNIMVVDCDLLKPQEDENKYLCGVKAWKMTKDQVQHADTLLHIIETSAEGAGPCGAR